MQKVLLLLVPIFLNSVEINLKNFDKEILRKALTTQDYNLEEIYNFILNHQKKVFQTNLKINFVAKASTTTKDAAEENYDDIDKYYATLTATYPILDTKLTQKEEEEKIKNRENILKYCKSYLDNKTKIFYLKKELEHTKLLEYRASRRQQNGIINLDDRIKIMESIAKLNLEISTKKIELQESRLSLLNLVEDNYQKKLKDLL